MQFNCTLNFSAQHLQLTFIAINPSSPLHKEKQMWTGLCFTVQLYYIFTLNLSWILNCVWNEHLATNVVNKESQALEFPTLSSSSARAAAIIKHLLMTDSDNETSVSVNQSQGYELHVPRWHLLPQKCLYMQQSVNIIQFVKVTSASNTFPLCSRRTRSATLRVSSISLTCQQNSQSITQTSKHCKRSI